MTTQAVMFIQLMPIPGTHNAPVFNGKNAKLFLNTIERHGQAAGITNKLVDYIYHYSSDEVQETIRYDPHMDTEVEGRTWDKAKVVFLAIFQISETIPDFTLDDLREFVAQQAQQGPYSDKTQIEDYLKAFTKISNVLLKHKLIIQEQANYYFVTGIPTEWKEWFIRECPEDKREADSTPTIAKSIAILKRKFDTKCLTYKWWNSQKTPIPKTVCFKEPQHMSRATNPASAPTTSLSSAPGNAISSGASQGLPQTSIDILTEQMQQLNLHLLQQTQHLAQQSRLHLEMPYHLGPHKDYLKLQLTS
ncbi:hypothetical protein VKT23_013812 [Stygiomarasmius scandens]|uniref:Uncharacterized protein n=1 Tax=Marasmiellus scandens TaxID=2682957 RepID=A0ABR1J4Q3_9AGAR